MQYKNMYMPDVFGMYLHPISMAKDMLISTDIRLFPRSRLMSRLIFKRQRRDNNIITLKLNDKSIRMVDTDSRAIFMDSLIGEIFIKEAYKRLNVEGMAVLDIGGTVGDTAIYFKARGAKFVRIYEPEEVFIDVAKTNFMLNDMKDVFICNERATSETINKFCDEFKGEHKALKLDCEGAEYEILLNSKRLSEFDEIILEYHYGYLNLVDKLEVAGFKVQYDRPHIAGNGWHMQVGFIYAKRR